MNWKTVFVSTFTSLLVAILAATSSIIATTLSNDKDRELQVAEIRNQQREAARVKREGVYQKFLDAANELAVAANRVDAECKMAATKRPSDGLVRCDARSLISAHLKYRSAINSVYIYGTPAAIVALNAVAAELPDAPGSGSFVSKQVNGERFAEAYVQFMTAMCYDVRPDPDQPCE
ncbi:hypothetical protein [Micromonospora haikouensis]|uniref:hypothetical protein n=1 Tax=Micromonospora haikouensis TaxID=686309 RepID=UPI003D752469